jgi:hypothetical protein
MLTVTALDNAGVALMLLTVIVAVPVAVSKLEGTCPTRNWYAPEMPPVVWRGVPF